MPPLLRLFGTPALVYDGAPHRLAVPAKALALLGLLAAQPAKTAERAYLASAIYPDEPDAQARLAARRQLHVLTKVLPNDAFVLTKNTIALSGALETDVGRFLAEPAGTDLAALVALRAGEYCAGVFDDALVAVRELLDRRYALLLERLFDREAAAGDISAAILRLEQLLSLDPFDEVRVRALMELRFAQGDRSGALRDYHALAQQLRGELDVEPERETVALFQRFLFAGGDAVTPHNLSAPSTSFIGREREVQELAERVRANRLVTIAGPPGVGKTRLARRVAFDALGAFPDGVWFIDLAPLSSAGEIYEQILSVMQSRARAGQDAREAAVEALREKRVLVLLDNCEHVIEAAADVARLLAGTGCCTVLSTSRRRLNAPDEHAYHLEPMETPPLGNVRADDIKSYAAVRLFAERAVAVSSALRVTDENAPAISAIVRKLDGMPLAIEIVSARANLLTVDGMLKRLSESMAGMRTRTSDSRYTTVEAAISWSHDLLSADERRLFEALAVFSSGWDVDAVEAVCAAEASDVFSTLSELVESSLVRADRVGDEIRYSMFETTHAFARARLETNGGVERVARQHAYYYAGLAEEFAQHYKGEREVEYYRKADAEYGNFRAAMSWAYANDLALGARMLAALWRYAIFTWRMSDIEPLAESVLARGPECTPDVLAQVHLSIGMFAKERMQQDNAAFHLQRSLDLFRACGDVAGEADALYALGIVEFNHGDNAAARGFYEACLALQERLGDAKAIAATTANLGAVAHKLGDAEEAAALFLRALAGFRATNNERGIAYAYRSLSVAYDDLERYDEAVEAAEQCVQYYEALGEQSRYADGLLTLGNALSSVGRLKESFGAFARAFAALERAPHPLFAALALLGYANTAHLAGDDIEAVRAVSKGLAEMETREMALGVKYAEFVEALIASAKAGLGTEQFEAAWRAGRQTATEVFAANSSRMKQSA